MARQSLTEQSPLIHGDLYHTAIVVDDLSAAQEEFGRLFNVTWHQGGGKVRMLTADGPLVTFTKYAISVEGPHHIELVEAVPGTLYTTDGSHRAHHVGYWVDDVQATSDALLRSGLTEVVLISLGSKERPPISAYHRAGDGFWIEIVARSMQPLLFPPAAPLTDITTSK